MPGYLRVCFVLGLVGFGACKPPVDPADAGSDGTRFNDIGAPCSDTRLGTCTGDEVCLRNDDFVDGYCTIGCTATACPDGAVCRINVEVAGAPICYRPCAIDEDCRRAGYLCSFEGLCLPAPVIERRGVRPGTRQGQACVMPIRMPDDGSPGLFSNDQQISTPHPGSVAATQPHLAVGPSGQNVAVAFIDISQDVANVGIATSRNGGASFDPSYRLDTTGTVNNNEIHTDPVLAVDGTGTFYLAWLGFDYTGIGSLGDWYRVWFARSRDGGASFGDVVQVSPEFEVRSGGEQIDKPWIAVNPFDGALWLVWKRDDPFSAASEIRLVRSTDGGVSWTRPVTVSDTVQRVESLRNLPVIDFLSDGQTLVVWLEVGNDIYGSTTNRVYLQHFSSDGSPVGVNTLVTGAGDSPAFDRPSLAVFGQTVYIGFSSGTPAGAWDLRVAASRDGGNGFLPSVKVNDDATCATHYVHRLAVDTSGRLHALWFDNRYHPNGNVFYAVSPAVTAETPLGFGPSRFVNRRSFPFTTDRLLGSWVGDYLGMAIVGEEIYAAWGDPRELSTAQVFFAHGPLPSLSVRR